MKCYLIQIKNEATAALSKNIFKIKISRIHVSRRIIVQNRIHGQCRCFDIQRQLMEFAQNYEAIAIIDASILYQDCNDEFFEEENENHTDMKDDLKCALSEKNRCKSCISCAFLYVYTLVTHTPNYNDLYTVYLSLIHI